MISRYHLVIVGMVALFVGFLYLMLNPKSELERYGFTMGALGEYGDVYNRCVSKCEREDPSKKLGITHGNLMCNTYCDSVTTDLARRGASGYIDEDYAPPPKVKTRIDEAYEICGDSPSAKECRSYYTSVYEVDEKCRQECAYSPLPSDVCMTQCHKTKGVNYNTFSWSFK